jgi:putative hydrolase of the HAD superfamily
MSSYQWIVFDADNTLFDYDQAERAALEQALKSWAIDLTPDVHQSYAEINSGLWQQFERGELTSLEIRVQRFSDLKERWNFGYAPDEVSDFYLQRLARQAFLLPGARELLDELQNMPEIGLALATNGIADVQRGRLERSGLEKYFNAVVISDEIGVSKPSERYFSILFESIGNPPRKDVLMVGDSLTSDIIGGIRFGLDTCWVNSRSQPFPENCRPTYQIRNLRDLWDLLDLDSEQFREE